MRIAEIDVGKWERRITVKVGGNIMTAAMVRDFVRALNEANIPDGAIIRDQHSTDTRVFTGLMVYYDTEMDDGKE